MKKKPEATETIKIRLGLKAKTALEAIAARECRTFAAQVRLVVRDWIERNSGAARRQQ
jgi:hypothetical protein